MVLLSRTFVQVSGRGSTSQNGTAANGSIRFRCVDRIGESSERLGGNPERLVPQGQFKRVAFEMMCITNYRILVLRWSTTPPGRIRGLAGYTPLCIEFFHSQAGGRHSLIVLPHAVESARQYRQAGTRARSR